MQNKWESGVSPRDCFTPEPPVYDTGQEINSDLEKKLTQMTFFLGGKKHNAYIYWGLGGTWGEFRG